MIQPLKIAVWNANGLANHSQELKSFLINNEIDIMLVSETHFTNKTYMKIHNYTIYDTKHPDGTAHGGTAVIIKNNLKHHELPKFEEAYLQATSINLHSKIGDFTLSAIYCPPRPTIKKPQFDNFFTRLGHRFLAGGDYNAKHTDWGSRLITPRGRELLLSITENHLKHLSTREPTYWPTDLNKTPDLLDFCVTKGIAPDHVKAESCLDLSSDHSPVIVTLSLNCLPPKTPPTLHTTKTDWHHFRAKLDELISARICLKTEEEIDNAVQHLTESIQAAAWDSTPPTVLREKQFVIPRAVKEEIMEKRNLRKVWQQTRHPNDKTNLNRAVRKLKNLLFTLRDKGIGNYLENLTATEATDYSLWKATKRMKQQFQQIPPLRKEDGTWARSDKEKALIFADHLQRVFTPFPAKDVLHEAEVNSELRAPCPDANPIKPFTLNEVKSIIRESSKKRKAPGFDLITKKIIRELSVKALRILTIICNAMLRIGHFPAPWKIAEIILIQKPGKPPQEASSYRPISLLPALSKLFEKLLLLRLKPVLEGRNLIPDHQFGFREKHATIEQIHRIVDKINEDLEKKRYCSAVFLDISQAFDKVWHEGLLYKIKRNLPAPYFKILKSYLSDRYFQIRYRDEYSSLHKIYSGVPQGSVLGPILYILFTADIPNSLSTLIATFADDTAVLASSECPTTASRNLQKHLDKIKTWQDKWRMRANEGKSKHVTFTLRKGNCPPVSFNGQIIGHHDDAQYLGLHLDRRMTWKTHIWKKRKQLGLKFRNHFWLLGRKSKLSLENKLLVYKMIFKPVWAYGIQLWGAASNSNIQILERFQSKTLRVITNAPWYVPNNVIANDLNMPTVKEEVSYFSLKYNHRLNLHPNKLVPHLLHPEVTRRLKRKKPVDLPQRFEQIKRRKID